MSLVNYLGTYETLDQVWETYPEGGKGGDYLYIASVLKKWNKYTSAWADPTEEDVEGSTIMSLEEDVVVGSSTLINYLGRFETLENAINTYPEGGNEGDYIYVGDDIYAWDKYANGWFVSSDTPLEVAISEEDIIPDSNTFINYLGGFVDRDAVWHKYPEGGKVGDYLYIASDLHIWDKYICNWVAATPPDESSQIRPIEHLSQEGVVEYSENYINYLGVFESIEQAWEAYPEGGKEGDYIIVGGEQLRWNKYTSNWGEYDPDASTPARPVATIYGDLHVHNDVIIGEDLYARILETFTTKKWVLEQGYISLDDVTSELVMSKIVPDNTTIEVRDGKLVVIGGGGGGTADSVAWDNVTGKPSWIGDTKPTYTLDEIAGSNGDGFVTLLSDQTIEGVKNFANGAKFNGALLSYDEEKKAWVFPGNIIASGGISAFSSLSTPVASLFEALPIDGTTIKRDPITKELYVDTTVVGGGGSGGGSVDPSQLEAYLKPYAKTADVASTYATIASLSAVTSRLNDFLSGSDTDAIINKWSELETFLAGLTETDNLATILSGKANKATTLAGYGITDAYTKSHIDSNFVTIGTKQEITGEKDFVGGFKVNGGLVEYNATLKAWVLNGDLLVTGGVSAFSNISGFKPSTIMEAVLIDNKTIKRNADGLLYAVAQETGGINEDQLEEYLRPYATQDWVTGKGYITGINASMVTNALGYTPYNSSNPAGYITSSGSITGNAATATSAQYLYQSNIQESINYPRGTDHAIKVVNCTTTQLDGFFSGYATVLSVASPLSNFQIGMYANPFNAWASHPRFRAMRNTDGTWTDWEELAFVDDLNAYLPLTGGTVNGNIKATSFIGNASSSDRLVEEVVTDLNNATPGRIFTMTSGYGSTAGNKPTEYWATGLTLAYAQNSSLRRQLAFADAIDESLYLRAEHMGVWGEWSKILTSSNFYDYALPITGGIISGDLEIGGSVYSSVGNLRIKARNSTMAGVEIAVSDTDFWQISHRASLANSELHFYHNANGTWSKSVLSLSVNGDVATGGNLLINGALTMNYSSDERLKQNIRKVNASKILMSLGGVHQYEYVDSEVAKNHIYDGTHYGLIYQNVKGTSLDIMCHEREDGFGTLNYLDTNFISLIAGATMENISEVEKLKKENKTLRKRVEQLEKRIA